MRVQDHCFVLHQHGVSTFEVLMIQVITIGEDFESSYFDASGRWDEDITTDHYQVTAFSGPHTEQPT